MRVAFLGTPEVAVPSLEAVLASDHDVVVVVTQPDRPRGRGRAVTPSPVKQVAERAGIPVLQPETPKAPEFASGLREHRPDALAVVAYGHILPVAVLEVAPAMNVHFSLLPRYRGAAPVQRALMDGATETGVSVFLLEPTVDTGPVVLQERTDVSAGETAGDVLARLAPIGARLLVRALDGFAAGSLQPVGQNDEEASRAPKISPEETAIDWSRSASQIVNLIRGLSPRPGAHTSLGTRRLTIVRATVVEGSGDPGVLLRADDREGVVVAAGEEAVRLLEVQPEGKRAMAADAFVRGYRPSVGDAMT